MQNDVLTIWLAIIALFTIDFSINAGMPPRRPSYLSRAPNPHVLSPVQAVDRALIVDTLPSADQADANAWAARMLGFGSVAGYFMYVISSIPLSICVHQHPRGNIDMTAIFPFFGTTELEVLAVVGSFLLLITHAVTAFCTKEKIVVSSRCVMRHIDFP